MESSKSIVVKKFGNYDVLNVEPFPLPPLGDDKVEVKVEYGGINFADLYTRQGLMPKKLPFVLGMECTGTITAIGSKITNLQVGQRVICYDYQGGMYSQIVRITQDKCYPLPDHINSKEGAAIFVNYVTAYLSLVEIGNLKMNETVLILSCGGGVGWASTQLAKTIQGVKIIGTTSVDKHEQVKSNGVDTALVLDKSFESGIMEACPGGIDLIISNQTGPIFTFLQTLLKPLGRIVLIGANNLIKNEQKLSPFTLIKAWFTTKNVTLEELITQNRVMAGLHLGVLTEKDPVKIRDILNRIFDLIQNERLKPKIDSVHSMESVVEATRLLAERKNLGKVLISMQPK